MAKESIVVRTAAVTRASFRTIKGTEKGLTITRTVTNTSANGRRVRGMALVLIAKQAANGMKVNGETTRDMDLESFLVNMDGSKGSFGRVMWVDMGCSSLKTANGTRANGKIRNILERGSFSTAMVTGTKDNGSTACATDVDGFTKYLASDTKVVGTSIKFLGRGLNTTLKAALRSYTMQRTKLTYQHPHRNQPSASCHTCEASGSRISC
jgi:hypothetical protein